MKTSNKNTTNPQKIKIVNFILIIIIIIIIQYCIVTPKLQHTSSQRQLMKYGVQLS